MPIPILRSRSLTISTEIAVSLSPWTLKTKDSDSMATITDDKNFHFINPTFSIKYKISILFSLWDNLQYLHSNSKNFANFGFIFFGVGPNGPLKHCNFWIFSQHIRGKHRCSSWFRFNCFIDQLNFSISIWVLKFVPYLVQFYHNTWGIRSKINFLNSRWSKTIRN